MNFISLNGDDEFMFHAAQHDLSDEANVVALVRRCAGVDVDVQLISSREWIAGRALVAQHYRKGNAFICGDSAHLFTPTGGFGMNTGVDDAVNLAWKLAGALQGWAGPDLLNTYERERRPIGVRNCTTARSMARSIREISLSSLLSERSPEGDAARQECAEILRTMKEEFASIGIQLGARYDGSPIIASEQDHAPPMDDPVRYTPTSLPGGRAPHLWLDQDVSLYDRLGWGFTLLRFSSRASTGDIAEKAASLGVPLAVLDIDMPEARALYPYDVCLIRPDMYVCWRGNHVEDAEGLLDLATGSALPK